MKDHEKSKDQLICELQALRQSSENRFKPLYNSNLIGISFWDANGAIVDANHAYLDMIGYSLEELHSGEISWKQMTPPEYAYLDEQCIEDIRNKGVCKPFEKEYIRKDGSHVPVIIGCSALHDGEISAITYLIDISEQKRIEEQLHRAMKMDALGKLVGGVVHDYNNTLGVIFGYAELLQIHLSDDPKLSSYCQEILRAGTRGANLNRKLLSYSCRERAKSTRVDINQVFGFGETKLHHWQQTVSSGQDLGFVTILAQ